MQQPFLEQALEHGIDGKNEYYEGRVEAGSNRPWVYRHLAEAASKKEGAMSNILSYDEIDMLTEPARRKNHESMSEFLANALHAGLLASVPRIPGSLQDSDPFSRRLSAIAARQTSALRLKGQAGVLATGFICIGI